MKNFLNGENKLEALFGLIGVLIGSIITIYIFRKERKDRLELSSQERKDKFKLVAIEKRLEAHQQALYHWDRLRLIIHEKDIVKRNEVTDNASEFWFKNYLYLEKKTRDKFYEVIYLVRNYRLFWQAWHDAVPGPEKNNKNTELVGHWNEIHSLSTIIMKEVELEPISIKEEKDATGNIINAKFNRK